MPESSLSLSVSDLKAEIGHFLGYGRGPDFGERTWTATQINNITAILKSGLSQVYTPPPLRPGEAAHSWSFLRPFASLTLVSGVSTVTLPDDFGGFETALYISGDTSGRGYWEVPLTNEAMVEHAHTNNPDTTGRPTLACEQVIKGTGPTSGGRYNLRVWPVSDGIYTIRCGYKYLPGSLTGEMSYPPGGAEHAELFKASVIAAAELQLDDSPGARAAFFMQRLEASINVDRRRKMQTIGINSDRSDMPMHGRGMDRFHRLPWAGVTLNGAPL